MSRCETNYQVLELRMCTLITGVFVYLHYKCVCTGACVKRTRIYAHEFVTPCGQLYS